MTGTEPADVQIRTMSLDDWPQVAAIWAQGIATGDASFETAAPTLAQFDASRHPHARLVAVASPSRTPWEGAQPAATPDSDAYGRLLGWASASPASERRVYAGVAESSVYVADSARGRGVGRALLERLILLCEATGVWTQRAAIFPENVVSLALYAQCGFSVLGRHEWLGRRAGRWRDVLLLERRSLVVGDDDSPLVRLALPGAPTTRGINDVDSVRGLLQAADLPGNGLDDVWRLWVADADGTGGDLVGAVALERYEAADWISGADADLQPAYLLRSLAVDPRRQGAALGPAAGERGADRRGPRRRRQGPGWPAHDDGAEVLRRARLPAGGPRRSSCGAGRRTAGQRHLPGARTGAAARLTDRLTD